MSTLRVSLGFASAAMLAGCAAKGDDVWILPAASEPIPAEPSEIDPVLALPKIATAPNVQAELWTPSAGSLRLDQVLASVDETFPLLGAARAKQIVAQAKELKAQGAFDLKLSAKAQWNINGFFENHTAGVELEQATGLYGLRVLGGYRVGNGNFDLTFDGKRRINHGGEFNVGVALPLLRGGAIDPARRDLQVAGHERDMAESQLAALRLNYSAEAADAYWSWRAAGQRREIAQALLDLAEQRQAGLEESLAAGAVAEIEVLDNRRLVVERTALVISARRGIEKAALKLALFLRDAQGQPLLPPASALDPALPPGAPPLGAALELDLERALSERPDVQNLLQQQARERVRLGYAENTLLPQLDVTVLASQDLDRRRPSATKGEFELVAGLKFEFPIQNRKARGEVLASEGRLEQLAEKLRITRDKVTLQVRDAFSALTAAAEREAQARTGVDLARRVADAERQRFELGDSDVLKLNLREAAAARAELSLVKARLDYWNATARYATAVGALPAGPGV